MKHCYYYVAFVLCLLLLFSINSFSKNKSIINSNIDTNKTSSELFQSLSKFIGNNIRYPAVARENDIMGNVVVSFSLNIEGRIETVHIEKGIQFQCDEEVTKRLLQFQDTTKKFKPRTYVIAICFRLEGKPAPEQIDSKYKNNPQFLGEIVKIGYLLPIHRTIVN